LSAFVRIFNRTQNGNFGAHLGQVLLILALSLVFGLFAASPLIILAPAFVGAVLLFIKPELGIILTVIAALFIRVDLPTATRSAIPLSLVLLVLLLPIWFIRKLQSRQPLLTPSPINLPALLFIVAATVSLIFGIMQFNGTDRAAPLATQIAGWAIYVLSCVALLLVANLIKGLRGLKIMTVAILIAGGLLMISYWLPATHSVIDGLTPISSFRSVFRLWLIALAGGQALFNVQLKLPIRAVLGAAAVLAILTMYFNGLEWLSGWMPAAVTLVGLLLLRSWRLTIALLVIAAILAYFFKFSDSAQFINSNLGSLSTRGGLLGFFLGTILPTSPVLGVGFANSWHFATQYPIWGELYARYSSHENYIDIITQMGVVGSLIFVWLVVAIGRQGWRLRTQVTDGFARGYVYGCLAGLGGMLFSGLLGDWFMPFAYNIGLSGTRDSILGWMFLGGLITIAQLVKRQSPAANAGS
jgi:hypothetical protein